MRRRQRIRLTVRWRSADEMWIVTRAAPRFILLASTTKRDAVAFARREGRSVWKTEGPAQVVVFTKRGRIAYEATYGRDPRRFPG